MAKTSGKKKLAIGAGALGAAVLGGSRVGRLAGGYAKMYGGAALKGGKTAAKKGIDALKNSKAAKYAGEKASAAKNSSLGQKAKKGWEWYRGSGGK